MPGASTGPGRWLLPALEKAIVRLLDFDPDTRTTLAALSGHVVRLEIDGIERAIYLLPGEQGLGVRLEHEGDVQVRIRSTVGGLMALTGARLRKEPIPAGAIEISGDLSTAQQVQNILASLDIDWEELMSRLVGDTAARKLGLLARDTQKWLRSASQSMASNFSEYVRYEVETVPEREQVEAFMRDVDTLRADSDRLAERIRRLKRLAAEHGST